MRGAKVGGCICYRNAVGRVVDAAPLNPHQVTRDFEAALCHFTGARYAVTTTSCTQAILMALAWCLQYGFEDYITAYGGTFLQRDPSGEFPAQPWYKRIEMPALSYVGVPMSIKNAGGHPVFRDENWQGEYRLSPSTVWDSARRFTSGMYRPGQMQCVSFHVSKILGDTQGGAILHDNPEADAWLRRARFDGRTEGADPKTDQVQWPSWHAYMSPDVAARLLWKLSVLPKHNADLPRSDYPRLDLLECFK